MHAGFIGSKVDPFLFAWNPTRGYFVLLLYADDIILIGSNLSFLRDLVDLKSTCVIKNLGDLQYFLSVKVTRNKDGLFLRQKKYACNILEHTNVLHDRLVQTPLFLKHSLYDIPTSNKPVDPPEYWSIISAFQYLTLTWPEIAHVITFLCQFM